MVHLCYRDFKIVKGATIMSEYPGKAAVIDNFRAEQATLWQVLAPLNEQQMTTPGVAGEWSIKDVLTHISAWKRVFLARLQAGINHSEPLYSWTPGGPTFTKLDESDENVDNVNNEFYRHNKDRSLQDVLAESRAVPEQIMDTIQQLSYDDLFAWTSGQPLDEYLGPPEHVAEHLVDIRAWLSRQSTS
jgi:hypothetical protein